MVRLTTVAGVMLALMCAGRTDAVLVNEGIVFPELSRAPADDPGWENIGGQGQSSTIYLGDRWILTAGHLGVSDVTLGGVEYTADRSTRVDFVNDRSLRMPLPPDLVMFQLNEDPGLPPLQVARQSPIAGQEVVVIGNGLDSKAEQTHWNVTQRGPVWIWSETDQPGDFSGYHTESTRSRRWGTNLVEDDEAFGREFDDDIVTQLKSETHQTITLLTEFDGGEASNSDVIAANGNPETAYEAQAVLHDSGGAMFTETELGWEVSGVIIAVEGHPQQPDVTRYAIFGSLTHYADVATYREQIEQHFVFGDFDRDLQITGADVDQLTIAMNFGGYNPRFDLDRNGVVDGGDRDRWVRGVAGTYFGDANLDGQFGTADFVQVLQAGLYEDGVAANATWATGDWNGDLEFDTRDLVIALQGGGFEIGPRQNTAVRAVPEPTAAAWGLILLALGIRRRF